MMKKWGYNNGWRIKKMGMVWIDLKRVEWEGMVIVRGGVEEVVIDGLKVSNMLIDRFEGYELVLDRLRG